MAYSSEGSFGARLGNARIMLEYLTTYAAYPPDKRPYIPLASEQSIAAFRDLINSIAAQNDTVAAATQVYTQTVDDRKKLFAGDPYSLSKMMAPISATVRVTYGKTSKEYSSLTSLITKIRGIKIKKSSKVPTAETVSQSERGYNSLTQTFADIISSLENYRGAYTPADPKLQIVELKAKLGFMIDASMAAANAYLDVKQKRGTRTNSYRQLKKVAQNIKDALKGQYGIVSVEYLSVRRLSV